MGAPLLLGWRMAAPTSRPASPSARAAPGGPDAAAGAALLAWYDRHGRVLPWRQPGGDPYRVWLSEVMLQQTTVAAVQRYFTAFTERWPNVSALAAAPQEEVMAAWAGLGYYARARNLLACARAVAAAGGRFPRSRDALRALPGVGDYTSAAVAAIAFGEPVAAVDGNVERVVARLTALTEPPKQARARIEAYVLAMLDPARAGDFAQAMMDLGATICTPRRPACGMCPLRSGCAAASLGDPLAFPVRVPRRARGDWSGLAYVPVRPDGAVLMRRRPSAGLLGGMTEVFGPPWTKGPGGASDATGPGPPIAARWQPAGTVTHVFTHAKLTLEVHAAAVTADAATPAGGFWRDPAAAGLPTLMAKVVARALAVLVPELPARAGPVLAPVRNEGVSGAHTLRRHSKGGRA